MGSGHALQHEDGRRKTPTSNRHKKAAAQAPRYPALQPRKMAELLGPCVKEFSTRAPPPTPSPSPATQHRLRLGAMSSGPFSCSEEPSSCKPFRNPRQGKHRFNLCTSSTAKVPEFALQFWKGQQSLSRPHPRKKECFNMKPSDVFAHKYRRKDDSGAKAPPSAEQFWKSTELPAS